MISPNSITAPSHIYKLVDQATIYLVKNLNLGFEEKPVVVQQKTALTWLYVNGALVGFIVSDDTRNPSVEIVHSRADASYAEVSILIGLSPELIALCSNQSTIRRMRLTKKKRKRRSQIEFTLLSVAHEPISPGDANPTNAYLAPH